MSKLVYTADDLVASFDALGVHFLTGGIPGDHLPTTSTTDLLAALIAQSHARLRLAIDAGAGMEAFADRVESDKSSIPVEMPARAMQSPISNLQSPDLNLRLLAVLKFTR